MKQLFLVALIGSIVFQIGSSSEFAKVDEQASYSNQKCDIVLDKGLCLFNGKKLIFDDAHPEGLAGYWSFNDATGSDQSGNQNNVVGGISNGPGYGGSGYSANIGNGNYITIPPSPVFDSKVMSISFYIYLSQSEFKGNQTRYCPILLKGGQKGKQNAFSPAVFLDVKERSLRIAFTTTANGTKTGGEFVESNAHLPYQKWSHITVIRLDSKIKLYINGILDAVIITEGSNVPNDCPLYIGNAPNYVKQCNIEGFVDDLRYYTRELNENEIESEASPSLGNMQPRYVLLGCLNCPFQEAQKSCIEGYHLCTSIELSSGAYQVARSMGWASWDTQVWSFQKNSASTSLNNEKLGVGLCCVD